MTPIGHNIDHINPHVRATLPGAKVKADESAHRLQWNENPFDYPADLKEEVLQRLANTPWSRYPLGLRAYDLMGKIAEFHNLSPDWVVVGSGSSDIIRVVMSAVLQPGDDLVVPAPTFQSYRHHGQMLGATIHEVPLLAANDFALPVDEILTRALDNRAKLIVVCAPNNPTGAVYPVADLRRLVGASDALVAIDEAYAEFCGQNLRPLLDDYDNIILLRTLSKAFAMAGVRVGYALAAPALSAEFQKLVTVFTLSLFSEIAATVALENSERFIDNVALLVRERERVAGALRNIPGVHVFPSGTNFLLVRLNRPPDEVHAYLRTRHNLLVSLMGNQPQLENCLRISIGMPEQNDLLVTALGEALTS